MAVSIRTRDDGSMWCNMTYGVIDLRRDHLIFSQGVLRPIETPIPYSSIISVASTDSGGFLGKNAFIQINTAGRSYSITCPGGNRGYDDVADKIRQRIEVAKEKEKKQLKKK